MRSFRLFLEKRDQPVLFIDLDGTLVHTSFRPQWAEMLLPQFKQKRNHFEALRNARMNFLSKSLQEQLNIMKNLGGTPVLLGDVEAVTFLRPGAKNFLIDCMGIARTCILTQGEHRWQEQVVNALDIPVKDIFGNRHHETVDYGHVPQTPAAILVDDMPHASSLVQKKLKAIGLSEDTERFIQIKTWEGIDGDKKDYEEVLQKIRLLVKKENPA